MLIVVACQPLYYSIDGYAAWTSARCFEGFGKSLLTSVLLVLLTLLLFLFFVDCVEQLPHHFMLAPEHVRPLSRLVLLKNHDVLSLGHLYVKYCVEVVLGACVCKLCMTRQ